MRMRLSIFHTQSRHYFPIDLLCHLLGHVNLVTSERTLQIFIIATKALKKVAMKIRHDLMALFC
jgi:hypothetical protein